MDIWGCPVNVRLNQSIDMDVFWKLSSVSSFPRLATCEDGSVTLLQSQAREGWGVYAPGMKRSNAKSWHFRVSITHMLHGWYIYLQIWVIKIWLKRNNTIKSSSNNSQLSIYHIHIYTCIYIYLNRHVKLVLGFLDLICKPLASFGSKIGYPWTHKLIIFWFS